MNDCFESVRLIRRYYNRVGIFRWIIKLRTVQACIFSRLKLLFNFYVKRTVRRQDFGAKFNLTYHQTSLNLKYCISLNTFLAVLCVKVTFNAQMYQLTLKSLGFFVTVNFSLILDKILGQITKFLVHKVTTSEVINKNLEVGSR